MYLLVMGLFIASYFMLDELWELVIFKLLVHFI